MKSIRRNYIYNLSYQLLLMVMPLITTPYLSRVLGPDGIGTYSYVTAMIQYFCVAANWGTSLYGQREISYVQNEKNQRSDVFWSVLIIRLITVLLSYSSFLLFLPKEEDLVAFIYIVSINIVSVFFDITWFFQGMEEFGRIVLRNFIFKIVNILLIFTVVKKESDLLPYAFIVCGSALAGNLSLWFYLPKFIRPINTESVRIVHRIPVITSLFLPTIAIQVYTVFDKTMIGVLTKDFSQNGCYEQSEGIAKLALTIVTSLASVMFPRIGTYYFQNDREHLQEAMYESYRFVWFIGTPLCLGLIGMSDNIIPWLLGKGYELAVPLLKIFSVLILAIGFSNVTGIQYLIPTKRQNQFTKVIVIGAATNFIMNLLLIPRSGAKGAAVSSITAETLIAVLLLILTKDEFSIGKIVYMSRNYLFAGTVMYGVLRFQNCWLNASFINSIFMLLTGVFVYFLVLTLVKDEFYKRNVVRVLKKIRKQ